MLLALLFGFLMGFFGSMPLAGPIALLVFMRGLGGAHRSAMAIAAGAAIAEAGYAFLAFWGMSELTARFPSLVVASRGAGALILLGLGVYFATRATEAVQVELPRERARSSFALGLSITALNPTFLATWTAAVAVVQSTRVIPPDAQAAGPFALGVAGGIVGWFWLMVLALRRWRDRFRPQTVGIVLRFVGAALAAMGVWAAINFVRGLLGA